MKDNPLIDKRVFENQPWKQEPIWVQRNALGIIVGMSEKPPQTGHIVPTVPANTKEGKDPHEHNH